MTMVHCEVCVAAFDLVDVAPSPLLCTKCATRANAKSGDTNAPTIFQRRPPPHLGINMIELVSDGSGPILHFNDGRPPERMAVFGGDGEWEYQAVSTMIVWRHKCGAHALVPQCVRCAALPADPPRFFAINRRSADGLACSDPACSLEHYGDEGRHAPKGCQHSAQDWFLSETDNSTYLRCSECGNETEKTS